MQKIQLRNGQIATIDFGRTQDLENLAIFLKTKPSGLAVATLQGMLEEVGYYRLRGCYVDGFPSLAAGPSIDQSEIGTVWVAKVGDAVAAAAFFHVTWKKNVYLDWLATVPEYSGLDIGAFLLIEILATATRIGSRLFFIESKKGAAAKVYKRTLKLNEECDMILLVRKSNDWEPSADIYGLAIEPENQ